jgi:hypothetical protein
MESAEEHGSLLTTKRGVRSKINMLMEEKPWVKGTPRYTEQQQLSCLLSFPPSNVMTPRTTIISYFHPPDMPHPHRTKAHFGSKTYKCDPKKKQHTNKSKNQNTK